jgi:hypothetical protein
VILFFAESYFICEWSALWRNLQQKTERSYKIDSKEGIKFGQDGVFTCAVTPVKPLAPESRVSPLNKVKSIDLNCKYPESDRGFATGLAAIEEAKTFEEVRLFLLDPSGEEEHIIKLQIRCH